MPCNNIISGGSFDGQMSGVSPNSGCHDGTTQNDSATYFNDNDLFGYTDGWAELDKTDDAVDGSSYWTGTIAPGLLNGAFTLDADMWNSYDALSVVLKDGGSTTDKSIKWSAYLLTDGVFDYTWIYDGFKQVSHVAIYGVETTDNRIPAPAPLALLGVGLVAMGLKRRNK